MKSAGIIKNYSLKKHNTFNLDVYASKFYEYYEDSDILNFLSKNHINTKNSLILGSGSNILFTKNFNGLVIHPKTKGIKILKEKQETIEVSVAAGELWDDFVKWAVNYNLYGTENLSIIPGSIGASAIQNIGAYGSEVSEIITKVKYINIDDNKIYFINNKECEFSYRNSIFKKRLKNKIIILSVNFQLRKKAKLNCKYSGVAELLSNYNQPGLKEMRKTIINLRNSKLPNYEILGNAGSFFKNPIINYDEYEKLKEKYPDIKVFNNSKSKIKVSAAYLIDKSGFKTYEYKGAAVYYKQPLIIINKENASGKAIHQLSKIIQKKVYKNFNINLEPEVIVI